MPEGISLPASYLLIDTQRHQQLEKTMFNPAKDGLASELKFSEEFNNEIRRIMKACSKVLSRYGEYGSYDRYRQGLASDWWISDDFYSISRVLSVEILNPKLQSFTVIESLREVLPTLPTKWMLLIGHDNDYDDKGVYVGREGEYWFWVREEGIEVYVERPDDLIPFYRSLKELKW